MMLRRLRRVTQLDVQHRPIHSSDDFMNITLAERIMDVVSIYL